MGNKFPYEKAVMAIAEADIYGDKQACERLGITRTTLWRWREKEKEDPEMQQNVTKKKQFLLEGWREDASRNLKIALSHANQHPEFLESLAQYNPKNHTEQITCSAFSGRNY